MDQPKADQMLRALDPLVGEWAVEAIGPDGRRWPGEGRTVFEWHPSGAHLVQRSTTDAPGAPDAVSIIGCDAANGRYAQLYGDERGVSRIYTMTFAGGVWTLERDGAPFPQRFVATVSEDAQTISGRWEKAEDGTTFSLDFSLTYRRI